MSKDLKSSVRLFFVIGGLASVPHLSAAAFQNGGFEDVGIASGNYNSAYDPISNPDGFTDSWTDNGLLARAYLESAANMAWKTTASDQKIELWQNGFSSVPAAEGFQFAEVNATQHSAIYQEIVFATGGTTVGYSFYHRGRQGTDTLKVTVTDLGPDGVFGTADDIVMSDQNYTTDNTAWELKSNPNAFTPIITRIYRFSFGAVSTAGNSPSMGNFIDSIRITEGPPAADPVITDVRAAQIPGTHQVRITYNLAASKPCTVGVQVWIEGGTYGLNVPITAFSGDITGITGNLVSPGTDKSITLTVPQPVEGMAPDKAILQNTFTKNLRFKVTAAP